MAVSVTCMLFAVRDALRKKLAPLAFLAALGVLAAQTCQTESASVTVRIELGAAAERVSRIRVDYFRDGQPIDVFLERAVDRMTGAAIEHEMTVPAGGYEARFRVNTAAGWHSFSRRIEIGARATVVVNVEDDVP